MGVSIDTYMLEVFYVSMLLTGIIHLAVLDIYRRR